jgi:hypothetical protein
LNDDKTKEKLGAELCESTLEKTKVYLDWLEANGDAEKDAFVAKQKEAEEEFKPVFMKMYASSDVPSEVPSDVPSGPKVEEVD